TRPAPIQNNKSDKKCVIGSKARFLGRHTGALLNRNRGHDRHSANDYVTGFFALTLLVSTRI
ncbi:MAG: hypothetical protein ACKVP1_07480, partial [Burkholderiaceae bacterium]